MTLRHFSYELPPDILDRLPIPAPDNGAFPERMRKCAAALLVRPNADIEEFLGAVRYDANWLKDEIDASANYAHGVLLCLAADLRAVPSLGRQPPLHHLTLAVACPLLGWRQDEIHLLLRGQPFGQYLRELGLDSDYLAPLDDIAGCLNSRQRQTLKLKLQASLDEVRHPKNSALPANIEYALRPIFSDNGKNSANGRVHAAIGAALRMLSSPASLRHHLLSILDY